MAMAKKKQRLIFMLFGCIYVCACSPEMPSQPQTYFSAQLDQQLWQAVPLQDHQKFNVSYKALSHQLSILASAADGSKMEISFHAVGPLKPGHYPSTINDEGVQSGIFYSPKTIQGGREMASATYDVPVQENTVYLSKLDKSDPKAYLIEGTFEAKLYALSQKNPKRSAVLSKGRFRVIYYPDAYHPEF